MLPKQQLEHFKKEFPWFADKIKKYKSNRKIGGIDIWLEDGSVLNYKIGRTGWLLQRGDFDDVST